jgi:hypothetical protein
MRLYSHRSRHGSSAVMDFLGYVAADSAQLAYGNVFQPFALPVQALVYLQGGLLQHGMGLLTAAEQQEVVAPRHPRMAVVGIEGQP